MAKIIPTAPIADFSELKITGALDYKRYSAMDKEELRQFILKDAAQYARKFVSEEWQDAVHIISIYTVIDSSYTKKELVTARLVYAHSIGVSGDITSIKKL